MRDEILPSTMEEGPSYEEASYSSPRSPSTRTERDEHRWAMGLGVAETRVVQ